MAASAALVQRSLVTGALTLQQKSSLQRNVDLAVGICSCRSAAERRLRNQKFPIDKRRSLIVRAAEVETAATTKELPPKQSEVEEKKEEPKKAAEKPKPTLKKGMMVRVDKEKYYDSVEALATNHPSYFKGIDYIFEDRGEVLDVRMYEAGEYAMIAWAGILTAPAWLPASMLIPVEKNTYKRIYGP